MSEEAILRSGVSALKAGDRKQASAIFARLVQEYPRSEKGWYLLGMSVSNPEQRIYCFKRVLDINPLNPDAGKQLSLLSQPASPPLPSWASEPPPTHGDQVFHPASTESQPQQPVQETAPPFINYEPEPLYEDNPVEAQGVAPIIEQETKKEDKKPGANKKKKTNWLILSAAIASGLILICTAVLGGMYLFRATGNFSSPVSPSATDPTPNASPFVAVTPTSTEVIPTSLPTAKPIVAYSPAFEEAPCSFETLRMGRVTCGYAIVPEDRTGDPSRTIRLAVAVFHSESSNPAPDPVMFLQGGPGGEAVQLSADAYPILVAPFIGERDYITYDQRGTGLSEPALLCDELDKVHRQDIYGNIDSSSRELVYQNAFLSCAGLLQTKGINLSAYNTVENAADLRDIVKLLGYEKVNLYGASYGTRLALVAMRNHPEVIRSAILDSVMPVEANWINEFPSIANYTITNLFNACKADIECNQAYPELEKVFWELVAELDANPLTLTTSAYPMGTVTETIDGSYLLSVVMGLSKTTDYIKTAPQTIYRVKSGDYSFLIAAQYSLPYELEGINPGLYISVLCHEHILDTTPENLLAASEQLKVKNFIWRPFFGNMEKMFNACKTWGAGGPVFGEKDAVSSEIPSLVITGTFDAATPPQFGKQVAEKLPNSYYFEFSNQGHVPTGSDETGCAMQVAVDFLENPQVEPSRDCLDQLPEVDFLVPYTGDPAEELAREQFSGISVEVPEDWVAVENGVLWRNASPVDITQVIAIRENLSVEELVDYFSSSINGYRGMDGAPVAAGTRQANGHSWTLYYTTSNGRPVDIAATSGGGGQSLIVILFSHPDEHDALYRTVFLPMVDSAR